jgi:hypothetical protein
MSFVNEHLQYSFLREIPGNIRISVFGRINTKIKISGLPRSLKITTSSNLGMPDVRIRNLTN